MTELVGVEPFHERAMYVIEVPQLEDFPETIEQPGPHFVAFVAVDATAASDDQLAVFARRVLAQGASTVCAWGSGCERVRDSVEAAAAASPVTTSWHADDTLDEALWFALVAAIPHERYIETTDSVLAIVVGDPKWAAKVRGRLGNPQALSDAVVADKPD